MLNSHNSQKVTLANAIFSIAFILSLAVLSPIFLVSSIFHAAYTTISTTIVKEFLKYFKRQAEKGMFPFRYQNSYQGKKEKRGMFLFSPY